MNLIIIYFLFAEFYQITAQPGTFSNINFTLRSVSDDPELENLGCF